GPPPLPYRGSPPRPGSGGQGRLPPSTWFNPATAPRGAVGPVLAEPVGVARLLTRDMRGLRVAWSADLGLPVEAAVRNVLAPARQVLADLGGDVVDAAPDLSGPDEVFCARPHSRRAAGRGPLPRAHRDQQ